MNVNVDVQAVQDGQGDQPFANKDEILAKQEAEDQLLDQERGDQVPVVAEEVLNEQVLEEADAVKVVPVEQVLAEVEVKMAHTGRVSAVDKDMTADTCGTAEQIELRCRDAALQRHTMQGKVHTSVQMQEAPVSMMTLSLIHI